MGNKAIVIGAGIIGASVAYHLAKGGSDVTIIEKAHPASGATSKTFAWINSTSAESHEYYLLREASIAAYHALEAELNDDDFKVRWGGSLEWALEGEEPAHKNDDLLEFGCPISTLDKEEFKALEPQVNATGESYIHAKAEGAINAVLATQALLRAASKAGANILHGCEVTDFTKTQNRITGINSTLGDFEANHVVVSSGIHAQELLAKAGAPLPMNNHYGLILRTKPAAPVTSRVILSPTGHFRQELDGTIVAGDTFSGGQIDENPVTIANRILGQLKQQLPDVPNLEIDHITLGKRPVPADGFPAVGYVENIEGLYVTSMHSGITLAPIIGKLVADEVINGTQSELLAPYRPTRFN